MAPAGAVGGGSYTLSDFGVQLLDVHKYYIVAAASSSSSNRYTAKRVPLTPRRRDASRYGPLGLAVLTAGAFRFIRAMPYRKQVHPVRKSRHSRFRRSCLSRRSPFDVARGEGGGV